MTDKPTPFDVRELDESAADALAKAINPRLQLSNTGLAMLFATLAQLRRDVDALTAPSAEPQLTTAQIKAAVERGNAERNAGNPRGYPHLQPPSTPPPALAGERDDYCDVCGGDGLPVRPICRACEISRADLARMQEVIDGLRCADERHGDELDSVMTQLEREQHSHARMKRGLAEARAEVAGLLEHCKELAQAHHDIKTENADLRARIVELERIPAQLRAEVPT